MDLNKVNRIYFLGIGGIGMSALARYFHYKGAGIFGYDLTSTPLTKQLEQEGMQIHYRSDISMIPGDIDFVIYTPAIPGNHEELNYFQETGIAIYKRSEVVGKLSEEHYTIAIAGTHGKTSISALTAHLLHAAGIKVMGLIGGIMKNYHSNLIISKNSEYFIIEADEYDRSFLQLKPDIAVISSMDADHLDVYGNTDQLTEGFKLFAGQVKKDGLLIVNEKVQEFVQQSITYGFDQIADIRATNVHVSGGKFIFNLEYQSNTISNIKMVIPGHHYIENALAAAAIGFKLELTNEQIKSGLESFKGVERRFEVRVNSDNKTYIDDYAHHPEEIKATVKAVKMLYPGRKITGIFQPHLFSRTKDFVNEFAESLENFDEIIILPIYPAREKPIEGVTSAIIYDKIKNTNKQLISKSELISFLLKKQLEVLVTMGAGDIGLMVPELEKLMQE